MSIGYDGALLVLYLIAAGAVMGLLAGLVSRKRFGPISSAARVFGFGFFTFALLAAAIHGLHGNDTVISGIFVIVNMGLPILGSVLFLLIPFGFAQATAKVIKAEWLT